MAKFQVSLALGLLLCYCCCSYILPAHAIICKIDLRKDLNENHPLLIYPNTDELWYPRKAGAKMFFCESLRVVCPQRDLQVYSRNLNRAEANLKCVGGNIFRVSGTFVGASLRNVACGSRPSAELAATGSTCPNGALARVGFRMSSSRWIPTINQLCHNLETGQTNWVHHRLPGSIRSREAEGEARSYATGPFYTDIAINATYFSREAQRARLLVLLGNQDRVNAIIPATGNNYLRETMLAPRKDMFYREQQDGTYFYANTAPVWSSIRDGNWALVEDVVRSLAAAAQGRTLDVYTGAFDSLTYTDMNGANPVAFTLTTNSMSNVPALPVPRFLFKYVYDRTRNQGLAFVTLNNPQAVPTGAEDTICSAHEPCASRYPEFATVDRGYTYCCTVKSGDAFATRARALGLPVYSNVSPLDLTTSAAAAAAAPSSDGDNSWLPFWNIIWESIGIQAASTTQSSGPSSLFDY